MKNLMFALTLLVASTVIATAQDGPATQPPTPQPGQDYRTDPAPQPQDQPTDPSTPQDPTLGQQEDVNTGKETISADELPQPITDQLQGQDYSGFTVQEASKRMRGDETIYEVELTSGDQLKKMKFDEEGNILKEKTKRNKN